MTTMHGPAVRAVDFESRKIYQSKQRPSYTCWVSFFPGEAGQWYIGCEEVTRPDKLLPRAERQRWHAMGMPQGYDKSQYLMEAVILESRDNMKSWKVISRQPYRHQHTVAQFATARTKDGRFLRFIWAGYSLDESVGAGDIFYDSSDNGQTWQKMPTFADRHFGYYPHRLRMLGDGTLVLCVPSNPLWGTAERPVRTSMDLNAVSETMMTLFFSFDQGRTWDGPLPIYGGQNVSETDFVELPSGDLLFINNSIFACPGRQFIYRDGQRFSPGPLQKVSFLEPGGQVPETVCLTEDGVMVGCMRNSLYMWSDDLGQSWWRLAGAPDRSPEMYQPWIHHLGDGRIACAGHYGGDHTIGSIDGYVTIHSFKIEVLRKTKNTLILVERDFDEAANKYKNAYTLTLSCDGDPLPEKELEFWYVERYQPGYDNWNAIPLEKRMTMGGRLIKVRTGPGGKAHVELPELDAIEDVHHAIQFVVRFNADRALVDYKPYQTLQFYFYSKSFQDPPLAEI